MPHAPLPSYDEALTRILACAPTLATEQVSIEHALGRTLREDIASDRDQPPFNRSAMDGFAVVAASINGAAAGTRFPVIGEVAAGGPANVQPKGEGVIRIATGAMLPNGFDATIPIEVCDVNRDADGRDQDVQFSIASVQPGTNIHRQAADASAGDRVVSAGQRLAAQHIAIAAATGRHQIQVTSRPRVTLITTGDEVMPPTTPTAELEPQQIRNSNGPMIKSMLRSLGIELVEHVHVPDEPEVTRAAAREALSRSHLVLTVGGVSAGERDFLPWAWKQLGLKTLVHGVAIQPGKPLLVAAPIDPDDSKCDTENSAENRAMSDTGNKLVVGLPGNPVSVFCTMHLIVWPLMLRMLGQSEGLPWQSVKLEQDHKGKPARELFRLAQLQDGAARLINWQGSGDLMHTAQADGWVRVPRVEGVIEAGSLVSFLPMMG